MSGPDDTEMQRVAVAPEESCNGQADRVRPVWRARGEEPRPLAPKTGRVHLGPNLGRRRSLAARLGLVAASLGSVRVVVEVIHKPYVAESLETFERCLRLHHARVYSQPRTSSRYEQALPRRASSLDKA